MMAGKHNAISGKVASGCRSVNVPKSNMAKHRVTLASTQNIQDRLPHNTVNVPVTLQISETMKCSLALAEAFGYWATVVSEIVSQTC